ncbi:SH3 domain-containing protein [Histidinibacterium aquaticum]|uniref:SH3 domain-containing protein n=1 Tax=Histidinibacterium aquaticum TaxID=2613962 RepID=A0A5J5GG65_9RHOB|nr:SH3 domain-containing protein [Histidinibacterium aquaticum]KAA9007131.1 SH3 domain-containing protein [Histidinibacterium aquaticum]
MTRFIVLTFAFLGWAFWEMSGGADFEPERWPGQELVADAATESEQPGQSGPAEADVEVTRASLTPFSTGPAAPSAPQGPAPAGSGAAITQASFQQPPENGPSGPQWTSAADAIADQIAFETGNAPQPGSAEVQGSDQAATVYVGGSRVNMRSGPGTGYAVLETLPEGTEARLLERQDGWARIEVVGGGTGWMADWLLEGL